MNTSNENAPKIVVLSNVECKNGERQCIKEFALDLQAADFKSLECKLIFAGSTRNDNNTKTSIICNSDETSLTDDNGILSGIDRVEYTKLIGIGSYNFYCPFPGIIFTFECYGFNSLGFLAFSSESYFVI